MDLEQIVQIASIISFIGGAIYFFTNAGAYKTTIDKDLKALREDVDINSSEIKDIKEEIAIMNTTHTQITTRLETLLIEVKTKLELYMQVTGLFNKNEKNKI